MVESLLHYISYLVALIVGVALLLALRPMLEAHLAGRRARRELLAKTALMTGAVVRVHDVVPAPPFERDVTPLGVDGPLTRYFFVDATVAPVPVPSASLPWSVFDLDLVDADDGGDDPETRCETFDVELWRDGEFQPEDDVPEDRTEATGSQRVRLYVGVADTVRRLAFLFGSAQFGEVELPREAGRAAR
jgi:hypothetical protein